MELSADSRRKERRTVPVCVDCEDRSVSAEPSKGWRRPKRHYGHIAYLQSATTIVLDWMSALNWSGEDIWTVFDIS